MMFFAEKCRRFKSKGFILLTFWLIASSSFFSAETFAQKSRTARKTAETKPKKEKEKSAKEKSSAKDKTSANNKNSATEKNAASKDNAKGRQTKNAAEQTRERRERAEKLAQAREEERRRQAEIARRAAERRAEIARREAERREALRQEILRRKAFEEGLRVETANNINNDDLTGEDLEIRQAAISALGKNAGTVVVLDAQNGRVYSMVNQDWAARRAFKPCSVIKLITGAAGLGEGAINYGGGIGGARFNLTDALAFSDNHYFQRVGANIGIEKMVAYAKNFHLGEPTGINLSGESGGQIPFADQGSARNYSHGDGFELTALQMARVVSAIANGGNLVTPRIAKTSQEKASFQSAPRGRMEISPNALQGLLPGMIGAVNYGTARRAQDLGLNIGGKTGSCIGQGSWLGLFASVAPVVNPKYAVVVVIRGSAARGKYAAAIAGQVYKSLEKRIVNANGAPVYTANLPQNLKPQTQVTRQQAIALASENEAEEIKDLKAVAENGQVLEEREIEKAMNLGENSSAQPHKNGKFGKEAERLKETAPIIVGKTPVSAPKVVPTTIVIPRGQPKNSPSRPRRVNGSFE